jgi:hypothetical protein
LRSWWGAGLIAGCAPVLAGPRVALYEAMKSGSLSLAGTGKSRVCSALVLIQLALALTLTLLIASGLLLRSLDRVLAIPLGFHAENLLTAQMRLSPARYATVAARRQLWMTCCNALVRCQACNRRHYHRLAASRLWSSVRCALRRARRAAHAATPHGPRNRCHAGLF